MARQYKIDIFFRGFGASSLLPVFLTCFIYASAAFAQTPPNTWEVLQYRGLFKAVVEGDSVALKQHISATKNIDERDDHGRTALHVCAYTANHEAMRLLVKAGADPNALENDRYDIVTIAAVANDIETLRLSLQLGASASNITSRYDGTALIAAAHLGHVEVVQTLIKAGAPLDHVNNLNWTALIESIVLGDGGERHTATLKALVDAGANINLADAYGRTPLFLARQHGYANMVAILTEAGAK
jgi:ankyrin repeat protein